MDEISGRESLALIEDALVADKVWDRLPAGLSGPYSAYQDSLYRQPNRLALALFTIIFDLFLISQAASSPELLPLSAALRLGLYTPAVLIFLALDRAGAPLPRSQYDPWLLTLAVSPAIISAVLCVHTSSTHSLSDVHATILILLAVGLILRMRLVAVYLTAAISFVTFLVGLILTPVIPREELPSLLLTDLAIAMAVSMFSTLLSRRDRLVFLLNLREEVRGRGLRLQNQGLRHEVDQDALTGLANRRCFDRKLAEAWARAQSDAAPIALIMIDVDQFKLFNDWYGHLGGDDCLRRIARHAHPEIRDTDLLARYGGEEFAAILPGATLNVARLVAERMHTAVAAMAIPHEGAGRGSRVSISLGVASLAPDPSSQPSSLIEAADRCLYAAKHAGRNRVSIEDVDLDVIKQNSRP